MEKIKIERPGYFGYSLKIDGLLIGVNPLWDEPAKKGAKKEGDWIFFINPQSVHDDLKAVVWGVTGMKDDTAVWATRDARDFLKAAVDEIDTGKEKFRDAEERRFVKTLQAKMQKISPGLIKQAGTTAITTIDAADPAKLGMINSVGLHIEAAGERVSYLTFPGLLKVPSLPDDLDALLIDRFDDRRLAEMKGAFSILDQAKPKTIIFRNNLAGIRRDHASEPAAREILQRYNVQHI
jgi:hypothetical protein